jgi:hypothetical protein
MIVWGLKAGTIYFIQSLVQSDSAAFALGELEPTLHRQGLNPVTVCLGHLR